MSPDPAGFWLVVWVVGAGTFAFRVSFILLLGRVDEVPPGFVRALEFVPPAVLAALVAPAVLAPEGTLALGPGNHRLAAGAVAAAVAYRTENMLATLLAGLGVLVGLGLLA